MKQLYYIVRREIMVKFKSRSFYLFALVIIRKTKRFAFP